MCINVGEPRRQQAWWKEAGCDKDAPTLQVTLVAPQKGHSHSRRTRDLGPLWAGNRRQEARGPRGVGTPRALFGWRLHDTQSSAGPWGRTLSEHEFHPNRKGLGQGDCPSEGTRCPREVSAGSRGGNGLLPPRALASPVPSIVHWALPSLSSLGDPDPRLGQLSGPWAPPPRPEEGGRPLTDALHLATLNPQQPPTHVALPRQHPLWDPSPGRALVGPPFLGGNGSQGLGIRPQGQTGGHQSGVQGACQGALEGKRLAGLGRGDRGPRPDPKGHLWTHPGEEKGQASPLCRGRESVGSGGQPHPGPT